MATDITAYPFVSQVTYDEQGLPLYDRPVSPEVLRNINKQYYTDGVFANPATSFQVSAVGGGLSVQVAPGSCNIMGTTGYKTSATNLSIEAPSGADRYDAIVLRWNDSLDTRAVQIDVVRGGGARPAPTRTDTIWELIIAYVRVAAGATSIAIADIEDARLNTAVCGLVRIPMEVPSTDPYFEQIHAYIEYLDKVINGVIQGSEYLLKTAYDPTGEVASAGGIIAVFEKVWPVGSYYLSDNIKNPAETLGFGTWVRAAIGRMLVGVNEKDTPFNTPGKTGGTQTHSLVEGNIPSHRHSIPALSGTAATGAAHAHGTPDHAHSFSASTSSGGAHRHNLSTNANTSSSGASRDIVTYAGHGSQYYLTGSITDREGDHAHNISGTTSWNNGGATGAAGAHAHSVTTAAANTGYYGAGSAVNHMNPYEAAYIWKRTA